jgi:hypothetical protein
MIFFACRWRFFPILCLFEQRNMCFTYSASKCRGGQVPILSCIVPFFCLWLVLFLVYRMVDPRSFHPDPAFVGHFCLPGSGSTDPIESGFNLDPEPQPCFLVYRIRIGCGPRSSILCNVPDPWHFGTVWILRSVPLTNRPGSGSCFFRQWPSRCQQKNIIFFKAFYFLKIHLHHSSQIKSLKEVT